MSLDIGITSNNLEVIPLQVNTLVMLFEKNKIA